MNGIKFLAVTKVDNSNTAKTVKSGDLEVFSTPMMIALMEEAATKLVCEYVPENHTTVGTYIEIEHISATPVGDTVGATAELVNKSDKGFKLIVRAYDSKGLIGEGKHKRAIINIENFMTATNDKLI